MGPPEDLLVNLKKLLKLDTFIETGTYLGSTASWAAEHFAKVYTIEKSQAFAISAKAALANRNNVEVIHASSSSGLRELSTQVDGPCVFWLDAHWSGGETSGIKKQCPLAEELSLLAHFNKESVVLIDDARLFLSTPPPPQEPDQWPTIIDVLTGLSRIYPRHHIVIIEDAIVCVPQSGASFLKNYSARVNQLAWEAYGQQLRNTETPGFTFGRAIKKLFRSA